MLADDHGKLSTAAPDRLAARLTCFLPGWVSRANATEPIMDEIDVDGQLAKLTAATERLRAARTAGDEADLDAAIEEWERTLVPLLELVRHRLNRE